MRSEAAARALRASLAQSRGSVPNMTSYCLVQVYQ